jgi:glyoxylate/hydroxypyruvate reductase
MTLQIVVWPEDRRCERSWLLEKIAGAAGAIVMPMSDKVKVGLCCVYLPLAPNINEIDTSLLGRRRIP